MADMIELSCKTQRGAAGMIRQLDDNSGYQILDKDERRFLNEVIHDPSTQHRPDFEQKLDDLATKLDVPECDCKN